MGNIADMVASVRKKIGESGEEDSRIPFSNDKVSKIMDYYQLTGSEIYEIFHIFRKMDKLGTGYINLDNIYSIIGEEVGIISPYLERLFSLIKKQHVEKVNFLEFLPVLATFCLYTRQQLISFVFCMLDTDHNGFISKKDMLNFVADERFGLPIFPQNFLLSIDSMEVERPDRISFEQFLSVEQDILFLIYPVTRLQKGLQKVFGGERLWESVYARILKLEKEEEKKNANFQSDNLKKRREENSEKKSRVFEELVARKAFRTKFRSQTNHLPIREIGRRGSDSRIKDKLVPLLEFSQNEHKSMIYVKKEFEAVAETEEQTNKHGLKIFKSMNPRKSKKLTKVPELNNRRESKIGKSVTSITSGRRKKNDASRKNSIESMHSLANPTQPDPLTRKTFPEKSNIVSFGTQSRLNLKQNEIPLKSSVSLAQ